MGSAGGNATDDLNYMRSKGITYEGFSPLCGPCGEQAHSALITGDLVTSIGKKYNKTGAQVSLKWQVQQGIPVIPKTFNPTHLRQNMDLFDWTLYGEDMHALTQATTPAVAGASGPGGVPVSGDCDIN